MIITFLVIYIIIFLGDYFLFKRFKIFMINEYDYLLTRFKLKDNEKDRKLAKLICSLLNSLIISLVSTFIIYIKLPLYLKFPLAFILLVALIYSIYGLYGDMNINNVLKLKEWLVAKLQAIFKVTGAFLN